MNVTSSDEEAVSRLEDLHDDEETQANEAPNPLLSEIPIQKIMGYLGSKDLINLSTTNKEMDSLVKNFVEPRRDSFICEDMGNKIEYEMMKLILTNMRNLSVMNKSEDMTLVICDAIQIMYNCMEEIIEDFTNTYDVDFGTLLREFRDAFSFRNFDVNVKADYEEFEFGIHVLNSNYFLSSIGDMWFVNLQYRGPHGGGIISYSKDYRFSIFIQGEPQLKKFVRSHNKHKFSYCWESIN
jgi:hypothetical protein